MMHVTATLAVYSMLVSGEALDQTYTGFRSWKNACGKSRGLNRHSNSLSQKQAEIAWGQFKAYSKRGTTIDRQMAMVAGLSQFLKIDIILRQLQRYSFSVAGKRSLTGGHRESSNSMNTGNFLEILNLIADHDPIVKCRDQRMLPIHLHEFKMHC